MIGARGARGPYSWARAAGAPMSQTQSALLGPISIAGLRARRRGRAFEGRRAQLQPQPPRPVCGMLAELLVECGCRPDVRLERIAVCQVQGSSRAPREPRRSGRSPRKTYNALLDCSFEPRPPSGAFQLCGWRVRPREVFLWACIVISGAWSALPHPGASFPRGSRPRQIYQPLLCHPVHQRVRRRTAGAFDQQWRLVDLRPLTPWPNIDVGRQLQHRV